MTVRGSGVSGAPHKLASPTLAPNNGVAVVVMVMMVVMVPMVVGEGGVRLVVGRRWGQFPTTAGGRGEAGGPRPLLWS